MFSLKGLKNIANRPEQTQVALGVVTLAAFIFGIWQISTYIHLPFNISPGPSNTNQNTSAEVGVDILALQQKDSDNDGLTDYDELYLYSTSPYLADTDSDGYSDKTEIDSGNNPNCAPDATCGTSISSPATDTGLTGTPTAENIRALLRQNGVSEDEISKYNDDQLLQLYREVAGEVNPTEANDESSPLSSSLNLTPEQKELIKNMSGQELRQFLINGGMEEATLEQIDDATLRTMIFEALGI